MNRRGQSTLEFLVVFSTLTLLGFLIASVWIGGDDKAVLKAGNNASDVIARDK